MHLECVGNRIIRLFFADSEGNEQLDIPVGVAVKEAASGKKIHPYRSMFYLISAAEDYHVEFNGLLMLQLYSQQYHHFQACNGVKHTTLSSW